MSDVLVVAAHPDDEILGAGGTILRWIGAGKSVSCLVLADGVGSRHEGGGAGGDAAERRRRAFLEVCDRAGFASHHLRELPDNQFDSVPRLEIVRIVEDVLREERPSIVLTHFEGDLNVDHRRSFEAVLTACRPGSHPSVREILSFEVPSSTEWVSPVDGDRWFRPSRFVDISEQLDRKIELIRIYEDELRSFPHPRSPEGITARAHYWGTASGLSACEPFVVVRQVSP